MSLVSSRLVTARSARARFSGRPVWSDLARYSSKPASRPGVDVAFLGVGGQRDQRHRAPALHRCGWRWPAPAVQVGHLDVADDDVELLSGFAQLEGFGAVRGGGDLSNWRRSAAARSDCGRRGCHRPAARAWLAACMCRDLEPVGEGLGEEMADIDDIHRLAGDDGAAQQVRAWPKTVRSPCGRARCPRLRPPQGPCERPLSLNTSTSCWPRSFHSWSGVEGHQRHQMIAILHHLAAADMLDRWRSRLFDARDQFQREWP